MSTDILLPTVTGDYSLDDFLDAEERDDPADEEPASSADLDAGPKSERPESAPEPESTPSAEAESESVSDDEPESVAESADSPEDADEPEETSVATESVEPARPTYDWSPDGAECAECGESTITRWRQEGEYVCADCKEW